MSPVLVTATSGEFSSNGIHLRAQWRACTCFFSDMARSRSRVSALCVFFSSCLTIVCQLCLIPALRPSQVKLFLLNHMHHTLASEKQYQQNPYFESVQGTSEPEYKTISDIFPIFSRIGQDKYLNYLILWQIFELFDSMLNYLIIIFDYLKMIMIIWKLFEIEFLIIIW